MRLIKRVVLVVATFVMAAYAGAQTLTVTSPSNDGYLGNSNTLTFLITGATYQTKVTASISGPNSETSSSNSFTPDSSGEITGSLPITFSSTSPAGAYTITVTATSPGTTFNSVTLSETVVVKPPVFLDFTPISGRYVQGVVDIRATISDTNFSQWVVQVDGADIPNNTGSTTNVAVNWDTSSATNNTSHTITITATDLAGNTATESMTVTIDRTKPVITVVYPLSTVAVVPGKQIDVIIDVAAPAEAALNQTGIDVIAQTTKGAYLTRVALVSATSLNSTTLRWTGRILTSLVKLPSSFVLSITAMDLAGNVATPVTSTVKLQ